MIRSYAVNSSLFTFDSHCCRLICKADASNGTLVVYDKRVHCKVLKCKENNQEGKDSISVELASLNAICCQNQSSLICYLGFIEFTFDNLEHYTVIVSECIDGISFADWNLKVQPFFKRVLVLKHLAEALSFVHDKGYCHNDLSPNNFMIVDVLDGISIVLFDLGAARPPGKIQC